MAEVKVTVLNKMGLHARPAAQLVKTAAGFKSDVFIARDDQVVNGKSIMGVMMLAAGVGTELTITVTGKDEAQALAALIKLFESKFNEE
jgi:phosphocarrier protein